MGTYKKGSTKIDTFQRNFLWQITWSKRRTPACTQNAQQNTGLYIQKRVERILSYTNCWQPCWQTRKLVICMGSVNLYPWSLVSLSLTKQHCSSVIEYNILVLWSIRYYNLFSDGPPFLCLMFHNALLENVKFLLYLLNRSRRCVGNHHLPENILKKYILS